MSPGLASLFDSTVTAGEWAAIAVSLAGVVSWMLKVAVDIAKSASELGRIRGLLEARIQAVESTVVGHATKIEDHGRRLVRIEGHPFLAARGGS